ncbi:MAG: hypothetical protein UV68_C0005G0010 [Candidatus Collierbacteria bacterium GW2011_GWC2_43_12]|uniref:Uncharacterized protein n=1 Tax=Candidatus Collierbacteria bacterium GW2011_GWC2_43_12 TaxID=1618390 RepID=A0A0G1G6T8_9BACT|nr:MAG: hypothetical protein UV68_C0005G0010 [Candidatus Collierbacteria bacterium GW2011_GWC2_43_12]
MLLNLISDIDPDSTEVAMLESLATKYGLFNMTVVLMKVSELYPSNGSRLALYYDETTYRERVATILAVAVINFAAAKYDKFSIKVNSEVAQDFSRSHSSEVHLELARRYLSQAEEILNKYSNP